MEEKKVEDEEKDLIGELESGLASILIDLHIINGFLDYDEEPEPKEKKLKEDSISEVDLLDLASIEGDGLDLK